MSPPSGLPTSFEIFGFYCFSLCNVISSLFYHPFNFCTIQILPVKGWKYFMWFLLALNLLVCKINKVRLDSMWMESVLELNDIWINSPLMELAAEKLLSLTILVSLQCLNQNRNLILKSFYVIVKLGSLISHTEWSNISERNSKLIAHSESQKGTRADAIIQIHHPLPTTHPPTR